MRLGRRMNMHGVYSCVPEKASFHRNEAFFVLRRDSGRRAFGRRMERNGILNAGQPLSRCVIAAAPLRNGGRIVVFHSIFVSIITVFSSFLVRFSLRFE